MAVVTTHKKHKLPIRMTQAATGLLLFVGSILMLRKTSYNFGTVVLGAIGFSLILDIGLRKLCRFASWRWFRRFFAVALALLLLCVVCCSVLMFSFPVPMLEKPPQAIVVLGAAFLGNVLSNTLQARLDGAYSLWQQYPDAVLVLSGGKVSWEESSEAEMMADYLSREKNVPREKILLETKAFFTSENFRYAREMLNQYFGTESYTAVFVTSDFHVYRSSLLALREGFGANSYAVPTPPLELPSYVVRESLAILKDVVFH